MRPIATSATRRIDIAMIMRAPVPFAQDRVILAGTDKVTTACP